MNDAEFYLLAGMICLVPHMGKGFGFVFGLVLVGISIGFQIARTFA